MYKKDKAVQQETEFLLNKRIKELKCQKRISEIVNNPDFSMDEVLKKAVSILPDGWQFPEITGAFIQIDNKTYQSDRYDKAGWIQSKELIVSGEKKRKGWG